MKRKFLILTLCFTIIFSSINFKRSYADVGVISLPILATVSALAVGTGIVISNNDDLYDIGRIFYDYIDRHNDLTWQTVQSVFTASVSLQANKLVSVKSEFLDIVKSFFDDTFKHDLSVSGSVGVVANLPYFSVYDVSSKYLRPLGYSFDLSSVNKGEQINIGDFVFTYAKDVTVSPNSYRQYTVEGPYKLAYDYIRINKKCDFSNVYFCVTKQFLAGGGSYSHNLRYTSYDTSNVLQSGGLAFANAASSLEIPYNGGYSWDNVESKKENESIALPIPGDLSSLVGQGSTDFWDNTDNLVGSGDISIPNVNNPSIGLDGTSSFPNTNVDNPSVPDVDAPTVDGILPSFPSFGDSLDFSPMYLTNVTEKFPFSLPWDIGRLISRFDVEPVAPVFEVPIVSETIILDLTEFSELASIVRFFILVCFILALIFISTKLMA